MWLQSWDMTFADKESSDFVCGGVWAVSWPNAYLVDVINERLSFTDTCVAVREMSKKYPRTITKLVEKKANGPAVVNVLVKELPGFVEIEPLGGKISRANAASPMFKGMNVFLNEKGTWVTKYKKQMQNFPASANDDMVDMTSQAIAHILENKSNMLVAMEALRKRGGAELMKDMMSGLTKP
jgi:predicted phage terminase large subunit-like protein